MKNQFSPPHPYIIFLNDKGKFGGVSNNPLDKITNDTFI